ncbi:MFS transporter [Aneurinibacillus sp. Ricciae_BoGa-3]|uniref:MFS transporter n=1 Tax=Aneurinibacillus sp. Ricciae_BoGa-3 TaxID=3022697 RepID=UPI0023426B11|nr:MFS transporter [Aneurinibacillus sp. Ricciae_BoGa-3]WCK56440.1 MFS transporter [Aneurinibacillus sp. Ricciae_BoGa-3]
MKKVGSFRFWIGGLFGVLILVNYLDRVNLSAAAPYLMQDFHLTPTQFGILASSFAWTYTLLQIPTGFILDKIGIKWVGRIATLIWTVSTGLTAFISGLGPLLVLRMLLGVGEAPAFAAATKSAGYWFPLQERSLATSIFDSATRLANVIGVPLVAWIVMTWGWRAAFVVTAVISLLLFFWFSALYRDPKNHPKLSKEELAYIEQGGSQAVDGEKSSIRGLLYLLRQPKVWGLTIGFAAYDYSQFMFLTWIPGYMAKTMHMDILKSGLYTAIPWLFGFAFDLIIGGWLIDYLIRRGKNPTRVRKTILVVGLILGLGVAGAMTTTSPMVAVFWLSVSLAGLSMSAPVTWSISTIIAPKGYVGVVTSFMNFVGNIAGIAAPILTGWLVQRTGNFSAAFLVAAVILLIGVLAYTFMLGKIKQLPSPEEAAEQKRKRQEKIISA